ncbi:protein FMP32, mitochondrial-like [Senna tora]|uniref:Protein FMP32, mitochondrial-like n=1 Tax=Senna tora TaxID=362788 RepID=A0A834XAC9_9FABA|nr:protein FMP32, mitochondrial-like [Senna tora]
MALYRRGLCKGLNSRICLCTYSELGSSLPSNRKYVRQVLQDSNSNRKQARLVDTLAQARDLEAHGIPSKQADAIVTTITDSLETAVQSFVSKAEMQKARIFEIFEQDHHFTLLQSQMEKPLSVMEKMQSELRDTCDELAKLQNINAKEDLKNKFDKEINALSDKLGTAKKVSQDLNSNGKQARPVDTLVQLKMLQESNLSNFKSQVQSSQDHHFSLMKQHIEKQLSDHIEKMQSELRILSRLTCVELAKENAEITYLTNKLGEINALNDQLEVLKKDAIDPNATAWFTIFFNLGVIAYLFFW